MREKHNRFLKSLQLRATARLVLSRMGQGDWLHFCDARTFLRSAELTTRPTVEIRKATVDSLRIRGLVYEDRTAAGEYCYPLTEQGELAARLIVEEV